jgi:hypothetical protein
MVSFKNVSSVGGNGILPLDFQEDVPKYDPSSFYNWEQDNVPLWVLEKRGNSLYNALGQPGGNPEGVTFTLSSAGNYDESKAIYDSIEDIVERIPKRLKFPVLIEICTYGNVGKLDLANITCEGAGKLEVRNRCYFQDVNASAYGVRSVSGSPADSWLSNRQYVDRVYSVYASATMNNVSSTRYGTNFGNYNSWYGNARLFCTQGPDTDRQMSNMSVYVPSAADSYKDSGVGRFKIPHPYDYFNDFGAGAIYAGRVSTPASGWGDATPYYGSGTTDYMVEKRANVYTQGQSTLVGYGAYFSAISLKDCQGTIILRDVLVDGGSDENDYDGTTGQVHGGEFGFDIENTEVILDNVASMRNAEGGFRAVNSRIKLTGHCIGYRNYTKTGKLPANRLQNGVGFYSLNSDLEWDSTSYEDSRKYLVYFSKSKRGLDLRNSSVNGGISYTANVSALPNAGSQLQGQANRTVNGVSYANASGTGGDTLTTTINISDCNEHGLYSEGSDIEFNGRINSFLNYGDGIHLQRSQARLPQFTSNNNTGWGINLAGSQLTYGVLSDTFLIKPDNYGGLASAGSAPANRISNGMVGTATNFGGNAAGLLGNPGLRLRNRGQFHVDSNNQNVLVDKSSSLSPAKINNIPYYFGQWGGCDWLYTDTDADASIEGSARYIPASHFGASPYRTQNKPGIVVTNNSDAEIVNLNYAVRSNDTGKGKIAIASNGSNIVFRGTSGCTTTMNYYPISDHTEQFRSWLSAGVVATNNSNVEFTGPTKSARFGVPFLAENNSNLKFNPPTQVGTDNILDISGYTLIEHTPRGASANHTSLEVQATRACMVANKQSNITLYGLGGRVAGSTAGNAVDSVDVLATDYADQFIGNQNSQFVRSTSGGYVKMYPHGFTSAVITDYASRIALAETDSNNSSFVTTNRVLTNRSSPQEAAMTGGMCVRAVQDSAVDVNLVNFYYQGLPKDVSGAYYNLNGTGCEKNVDVVPDGGGGSTSNTYEVSYKETPSWGAVTPSPLGDPPGGGTGVGTDNSNFTTALIVGTTNNDFVTGTVNHEGTGALYTAAGRGVDSGSTYAASFSDNQNPGSMTVIGDERAPAPYTTAVANGDQGYRFRAYLRNRAGNTITQDWSTIKPTCMGSQIQIWNIADTSRIHASNILANGYDPTVWSLSSTGGGPGSNCHGPTGKWFNGVSLDYFGLGGRRTTYGGCGAVYANTGIFRLMLSTRGDLKSFYDVSTLSGVSTGANGWRDNALSGGSPVDQINGAGYTHWTQNVRVLGSADNIRRLTGTDSDFPNTVYQLSSCLRVFGWGHPSNDPNAGVATMPMRMGGFSGFNAVSGQAGQPSGSWIWATAPPPTPMAPLGMDSLGFMRNWLDETAAGMWQNGKHLAEDKVNGVSIYRSYRGGQGGGEGRDCRTNNGSFGVGVRSLNLFDLERLM